MKPVAWLLVSTLVGAAVPAVAEDRDEAAEPEPADLPFGAGYEARQAMRGERIERPQRPERPTALERPQRPERPERERGRR